MPPPSQPPHPTLTPQLCLTPNSLRTFLRLSRAAIDDPISQHLASLSHPSALPFDPSSISAARPASPSRRNLPSATCAGFVSHTLFPAWAARARVLEYCAGVAETAEQEEKQGSAGPLEPDTSSQGRRWGGGPLSIGARVVGPEAGTGDTVEEQGSSGSQRPSLAPDGQAWSTSRRPRVVGNERLDPYSARDYHDESPAELLARVIREERSVESIVRMRSWGLVKDRCGGAMPGWEEGMRKWEDEMGKVAGLDSKGRNDAAAAVAGQGQNGQSDGKSKSGWSGLWG